jgi:F-box and leucine-rich repeat protein 2/20
LRFVEGITDEGLVGLVKKCGQSLVSLAVATCVWLTDASLHAVGSHCPNLEILSLESDRIQNGGVISVAKGCRLLKTLKLQCVGASDEALDAIGSFCLLLEILSLSNFERFTDRYLCNCILYPDVICIVAIFLAILCAEIQEGRTLISIRISQNNVEVLCNQCQ